MNQSSRQAPAQTGEGRSIVVDDDYKLARDFAGTDGGRVQTILNRCAARHGVTVEDIKGHSRRVAFVAARYEAIALVSEAFPRFSSPHLGEIFGGRCHTTILYALGRTARGRARLEQLT